MTTPDYGGPVFYDAPTQGGTFNWTDGYWVERDIRCWFERNDGTLQELIYGSDFTVTPMGFSLSSGTITLLASVPSDVARLKIDRDTTPGQSTALEANEVQFERMTDRQAFLLQEHDMLLTVSYSQSTAGGKVGSPKRDLFTIPLASDSAAGLITAADFMKLAGLGNTTVSVETLALESRAQLAATIILGTLNYVRTAGFAAAGDGGGALWKRVGADPGHAGAVQSADLAWWEIVPESGELNIYQFGAIDVGLNPAFASTESSVAVQNCLDTANALSCRAVGWGHIYCKGITITGARSLPRVIDFSRMTTHNLGQDDTTTYLLADGAALERADVDLGNIENWGGSGHCVSYNSNGNDYFCIHNTLRFSAHPRTANRSAIYINGAASSGGCYSNRWQINRLQRNTTGTAPIIDINDDLNATNTHDFQILWLQDDCATIGASPAITVDGGAGGVSRNNHFRIVVVEKVQYGLIATTRAQVTIEAYIFDVPAGDAQADFIYFGSGSEQCHVIGYDRSGPGDVGAFQDIVFDATNITGSVSRAKASGGVYIDTNGWFVDIGDGCFINTLANVSTTGGIVATNQMLRARRIRTRDLVVESSGELTISAGVITVSGSSHTIDTESDAVSDDLDTISGGADGMIVILSPANDARTVVIRNGTGNIWIGADFPMDSVRDSIMLIYRSVISSWVRLDGNGT